jgi:tetratricopeptide (TPR) repeat protein
VRELHLTDEQISILVDGSLGATARALLHEHMGSCESCYCAYQDALLYKGIFETDATVFRAPDDIMEVARNLSWAGQQTASDPEPHRPSFWRSWAPALGGLAAASVLFASIAIWQPSQEASEYSQSIGPIQSAVVDASTGGSIVIPGAEASAASTSSMFRSGHVSANPALVLALDQLNQLYQENNAHPEVASWLISGYLATGQLENAQIYVQDARRRFTGDPRFLILDGLISYRLNDMGRAERLLQAALQTDPDNGTALVNLGLVQYEQGQWDSARRTLETVQSRFSDTPLGVRASSLLSDLL